MVIAVCVMFVHIFTLVSCAGASSVITFVLVSCSYDVSAESDQMSRFYRVISSRSFIGSVNLALKACDVCCNNHMLSRYGESVN